ncbi:tRNA pseudouridine(38-40) synthase TruA [Chitinophaga sp. GCM10012297]|uniref:tRNA pseudouridine synthase A n=1 Tax=Chitinophaga chungangae TaxID=2821488 RepID=A0ABS3YBX5_9BACT|nr:tRNA pseudouridine(38-40) synthase TruA [Chitinophaga chungangae]MBO9152173.1 tRNA pseudouridine(38-40) synthase TruA [Chitinophaga chungangae]
MARYFIEVAYMGGRYAGFQVQENAQTVQGEIDRAVSLLLRETVETTGSSRTDAGVHARQNFLHFDTEKALHPQFMYKMNAILPQDVVLKGVYAVPGDLHSRFAATGRAYAYTLYGFKDPFMRDRGYYYPYTIDLQLLQEAAAAVKGYTDFSTFSKRNTQVKTYNCAIEESYWEREEGRLVYRVSANRFLRGMVRGLVGTMLRVGRGKLTMEEFRAAVESKDCTRADFAVPGHGLCLMRVMYAEGVLGENIGR